MKKRQIIGFIGTGIMGTGMVHNLLLNEYDVNILAHKNRAPIVGNNIKDESIGIIFPKGNCTPAEYRNFVLTQFRDRQGGSDKNHFRPRK